ncbi:hypothetical protein [Streptacidiphilus jiangxiensis]|uniref:DUF3137 domain-containing protein n=1 Tax=Streptacidiphilus jiangxiensis TaxID=235985 RepID=A0A1H7XTF5_STRJI|nr:hypothetical protein [Streptacidiphilus jiangxiensis]SEM37060.1 hypothetical protein SAMN05414137_12557 [Streptacidiphilus jiangxiensis]
MIGAVVAGVVVLGLLGMVAMFSIRASGKASKSDKEAALAGRPGWATADAKGLAERYRRASPFSFGERTFGGLLRGPLLGGLRAETFLVLFGQNHDARNQQMTSWTVATVIFPYPLPMVALSTTNDPRDREPTPQDPSRYSEGSHGPAFAGLRGFATDPAAAAALFTPEVLDRTRALRADWRMDGHVLIAVVKERLPAPARMTLVDNMAWIGTLLPAEVRETAALQSDPWPGPTAERPA